MITIDRIHSVYDDNTAEGARSFVESLLPLQLTDIERRDRFAPNYLVRSRAGAPSATAGAMHRRRRRRTSPC